MTNQKTISNFISHYKQRLIAIMGITIIPSALTLFVLIGTSVYSFVNNDNNFHPYKSYVESGYNQGKIVAERDMGSKKSNFYDLRSTHLKSYQLELKKIKRENYESDQQFQDALKEEAWKLGYEHGYGIGKSFGVKLTKDDLKFLP